MFRIKASYMKLLNLYMDNLNYKSKQNSLHKKALEIINELRLVEVLNEFGDVHIVGSVALELMSWPDIDIVVFGQPDYANFLKVVNSLFHENNIYSLNLQDFRKSIYPERPQGIYCGVKYLEKPETFWKIDIWFLPKSEDKALKTVQWVKKRIDDKNRELILKIKNEMRIKLKHGTKISGIDVYKAVLENGVKSLNEFRDYLKKSGSSFV